MVLGMGEQQRPRVKLAGIGKSSARVAVENKGTSNHSVWF